jgi:hypothetical protein
MSSPLDKLNRTELFWCPRFLLASAEDLPKGDPKRLELLRAASELLDRKRAPWKVARGP